MQVQILLAVLLPVVLSYRIQEINLKPEEAQDYLSKQALDIQYAKFLGEHPIPYLRSGEAPRQYYHKGRLIDNPADFVEEEYLANQFHGQDGLGRAIYGYQDWNQGKFEAINGDGDVRGSYKYINPNGDEIEVKYWADSLGFHHEDNIPKVELKPVEETPAVRKAREEHERLWKEAAAAASQNPDPQSDYYNRRAIEADDERSRFEQAQELMSVANQQQALTRYPSLPKTITPQTRLQGQQTKGDSVVVDARGFNDGKWHPEQEGLGEPHGFFYAFDYPVSLVIPRAEQSLLKRPPGFKL